MLQELTSKRRNSAKDAQGVGRMEPEELRGFNAATPAPHAPPGCLAVPESLGGGFR